jgi:hypothetical protein
VNDKLGHNRSFVWCSIHASQVVVRGGPIWRMGDGLKVRVWSETWICDGGNGL